MAHDSEDFAIVFAQAGYLREASRYADAATQYARAVQMVGGTEREQCEAKYLLGDCYLMLGRFTEALACFGEVYVASRDRVELHSLAYRSLFGQIDTLRCIEEADMAETDTSVTNRLTLIEDGIRWLYDIGRETWRHALLYERSLALSSAGLLEKALDSAEEAYRLYKQFDGPGFSPGIYARRVAGCARDLGRYERCLQVLDETEGGNNTPADLVGLLIERIRVFESMRPPQLVEALVTGRRLVRVADEIQAVRERSVVYAEMGYVAIVADSLTEARDALGMLRQVALEARTVDRAFLLRQARNGLRKALSALIGEGDRASGELRETLAEWMKDVEEAPESPRT